MSTTQGEAPTADAIGLVASELITNAVVHGRGPITVTLSHSSGSLVIDVLDTNSNVPKLGYLEAEDEGGRGLILVDFLALARGGNASKAGSTCGPRSPFRNRLQPLELPP
ncbi:ATP-binding protein [Streptomyces sp. NPDC096198]|uniref:ATP-binding protein n=1 Tax=Streptomyces sp. NPDC096198 TaxID=3366080 RepID=UPI0037F954C4